METKQLARIESLGDNCELGFVLRKLGCNSGSLFRWASMQPTQLLAMLSADFAEIYRFENLAPLRLAMVVDRRYGVGWHTDMVSEHAGAALRFRDGERARRPIHRREKRKIDYLIAKFRSRARHGGTIFVVKANSGIEADVVRQLHAQLSRYCQGAPFALLEVSQTDDRSLVGTVSQQGEALYKGHVAAFASYDRADDSDLDVWSALLAQVMALNPCADWETRLAAAQAAIPDDSVALPFPATVQGTGARVQLIGGDEWCRCVETGFRIHGALPSLPGTLLQWAPFPLRGIHHLSGTIRSAVPDAAPVAVTVRTRNTERTDVRERRSIVTPDSPWLLDFVIDPDDPDEVVLEICVEATRQLQQGERAVVDVSPLTLHPAAQ